MDETKIETIGAAMTEGRWADVLANLPTDVVTHVPAVGTLTGIDELAEFQLEVAAKADAEERFELLDTLIGDRFAAFYFRVSASREGREPLDNLTLHLARIEGDEIVEIWFHNFDTRAVAAFWE